MKKPLVINREAEDHHCLKVSELTSRIKAVLEDNFGTLWVEGEISNLSRPHSGHVYFTLKDSDAQIAGVMFRGSAAQIKFNLEDGMAVQVYGELTVYQNRGQYQIVVQRMEPIGIGALQLAFQQLKEKLGREGLFAPERKKSLPFLPRTIGMVTSITGAAIRDMLTVLERRFSRVRVLIRPVPVQGDEAAPAIAKAIQELNQHGEADVIIVGRGGGSLEDLWAFNEEIVARAIAASRIPIISAVGHEIDYTIADYVADFRAPTPTAAAEHVVPEWDQLMLALDSYGERLRNALLQQLRRKRERLDYLSSTRFLRAPKEKITAAHQRLDELSERLNHAMKNRMQVFSTAARASAERLEALSPLKVLERGFSVTSLEESPNTPVRSADNLHQGQRLLTRFSQGSCISEIISSNPEKSH